MKTNKELKKLYTILDIIKSKYKVNILQAEAYDSWGEIQFRIKGAKRFRFGLRLVEDTLYLFSQHEFTLDKFKPSHSFLCQEIRYEDYIEEYNKKDILNFIKSIKRNKLKARIISERCLISPWEVLNISIKDHFKIIFESNYIYYKEIFNENIKIPFVSKRDIKKILHKSKIYKYEIIDRNSENLWCFPRFYVILEEDDYFDVINTNIEEEIHQANGQLTNIKDFE